MAARTFLLYRKFRFYGHKKKRMFIEHTLEHELLKHDNKMMRMESQKM